MKQRDFLRKMFLALLAAGVMLVIAYAVPMPLNTRHDFQVLYQANRGILQGISLYDREGQARMVADEFGISVEDVFVLPFPYPPWYAVATLPLALLPIEVATRMWFLLNLALLLASVHLLTTGWTPKAKLAALIAAPLFIPAFGALVVGQYMFPTLLGVSLLYHALRERDATLTAVGLALVTFKPHLGIFIASAVLAYLIYERGEFFHRAVWRIIAAGGVLFVAGFIADRSWVVNYFNSLTSFRSVDGVSTCGLCASLPVALTALWTGEAGMQPAMFIAAGIFVLLLTLLAIAVFKLGWSFTTDAVILGAVFSALLASPYLLNYDYVIFLVPLFILWKHLLHPSQRAVLLLVYLFPMILFAALGRGGTLFLPLGTIALLCLTAWSPALLKKPLGQDGV